MIEYIKGIMYYPLPRIVFAGVYSNSRTAGSSKSAAPRTRY